MYAARGRDPDTDMERPMEVERGTVQERETANLVGGQGSENYEGCDGKTRTASCHCRKRDRNTLDEAVNASLGVDLVPPSYLAGPGKVNVLLVQSMALPQNPRDARMLTMVDVGDADGHPAS